MSQFLTRLERVFFYPDRDEEEVNYSELSCWLEQGLNFLHLIFTEQMVARFVEGKR